MSDIKSPWDQKFCREYPFMAFGSMMNAFGRINEGKGMTLAEFEKATDEIFRIASRYTQEAFSSVGKEDEMEIPIKKKTE